MRKIMERYRPGSLIDLHSHAEMHIDRVRFYERK